MDEQKPVDKNNKSQDVDPLAPEEPSKPIPHSPEFQQQLEQFQKAAANPENQNQAAVSHHKKGKLLPILLVVLVIALVAGGAYWFMNKNKQTKPVATKTTQQTVAKTNYLTGTDKYVCANAALTAILCENVETKAITKYEVPHFVGIPGTVTPSPDGSKVLIVATAAGLTDVQHVFVVDNNGKLVKQLPDFTIGQNYGINWLSDSKTIVYDWKKTVGLTSKSQLYTFDVSTGKSKQLTTYKNGLYYPVATKSGLIIAYGGGGDNTTSEELVAVSPDDGSAKVIDSTAAYADLTEPLTRYFYNRSQDLFYAQGTSKSASSDVTIVAKIVDTNGKLKLVPVATYKKNIETSPIVTSKGTLLTSNTAATKKTFQLDDGKNTTELTLDSTMLTDGILYSTNMPLFAKADTTSKLVQSDFLYENGTAPAKLHNFLVGLTTQDCKSGQYRAVTLIASDSDKQAVVSQSSCEQVGVISGVIDYYVYQNGAYKKVVSTKDVVSCKDATKYALSKSVLPKCNP